MRRYYFKINASFGWRRLQLAVRRVPAALFRERALLHYPVRCAANRDVILSRRACGVSKNLLWLPRSNCYAIMPAFYTQTLLHSCKILRLRASLFARHFAQDDMRAAGCPRGPIPRERCPLCLIPRTGVITLQNPLRGQRECRRCLIPRSARMTTVRGACLKQSLPAGCRARLA